MSQIICVILTWNTVSSQPTVLAISLLGRTMLAYAASGLANDEAPGQHA